MRRIGWMVAAMAAVLGCGESGDEGQRGGGTTGGAAATPSDGTGGGGEPSGGDAGASSASGGSGATGGSFGGVVTGGGAMTGGATTGGAMTGGTTTGGATTGGATTGGATTGGATTGGAEACGGGDPADGEVVVALDDRVQRIAGFGASTAWASSMSATDADLLWSTTSGAGLSLHRIRIAPDGTTSETAIAKLAVARGATIWATPWSPTPTVKSNGSDVMGKLVDGQAWASTIRGFVDDMRGEGIDLYAVSAQNEPDADVTYESCDYTPSELAAFVGSHLGPALAGTGTRVMAPETQNWCGFSAYADAIIGNPAAAEHTSIIATHEYGCADAAHVVPYRAGLEAGMEFWQTEIYDQGSDDADPGMDSALRVVELLHDALTRANMSAWHYWWVYPIVADNGALWDLATNAPTKRLWVMGNYSRFVRPGFRRVTTSGNVPTGVLLSAFVDPASGQVVVVAANHNHNEVSFPLFVSGAAPCTMTPWLTSEGDSLAGKPSLTVSRSRVVVSLPARSVTTLVGAR